MIASLYILVNLLLSWLATWAQKKFVGEHKPLAVTLVGAGGTSATADDLLGINGSWASPRAG